MNKTLCVVSFFAVLAANVSYFSYIQPTYVGWLFNVAFICSFLILLPIAFPRAERPEQYYIFLMLVGYILHLSVSEIDNRLYDSAKWILPVILLMAVKRYSNNLFKYSLLAIFTLHCLVAIGEYTTQSYFTDYYFTEDFGKYYEAHSQFRAFGLMAHPLYAANVTLIVMSFLLVSTGLNKLVRLGLLILGSYALICINSRAAMIIWGALLAYRIFFYHGRPIVAITLGAILYLLSLSDLFSLMLQSSAGLLGRLGEANNLSDSSTSARLISFAVFAGQSWDFYDAVVGGRVFYLPGTTLSLENGLLLTIAWHGWIVGILKVVLELAISWTCLKNYDTRDKFIVLIGTWLCAYSNNNTMNSFVFAFFIVSFISINYQPIFRRPKHDTQRPVSQ